MSPCISKICTILCQLKIKEIKNPSPLSLPGLRPLLPLKNRRAGHFRKGVQTQISSVSILHRQGRSYQNKLTAQEVFISSTAWRFLMLTKKQ
jgi:hypothetical protein